jgi:uncharacterized membrane protein
MELHMLFSVRRCAMRSAWACAGVLLATAASAQTIHKYNVNFTENAPTIDGVASPGEWDDAVAAEGGWHLLRDTSRVDNQNSRWQAVWDDEALYVLFQSDYHNWSAGPAGGTLNFNDDNINFYFDPNVDGEANVVPDNEVDGYQIAFNQYMGHSSVEETVPTNTAIFQEGHEDSPFGNQSQWLGLFHTHMEQNNGATGGIMEVKFPWGDFDADNPDPPENNAEINGLYHPLAPEVDETWFFKISRITTDPNNFLPDWNPTDSQSFAVRPHGEITFVKGGASVPGDTDGNGKVDLDDLNNVRNNFGGQNPPIGDTDGDNDVDLDDLNAVRNNFGAGGSNSVPEPSTWALLAISAAALGFAQSRKR